MSDDQLYLYEGSAREFLREQSSAEEISLEHGLRHAYAKATQNRQGPFRLRVVDIIIEGDNPPSDYKVRVVDHP